MEWVAQLIFGFVSVSQLRPRTASQAALRGDTKKCMDMCRTLSVLDSMSSTLLVIDLDCSVLLNKQREMGVDNGDGMMWLWQINSGEMKQSEVPESNRMQTTLDPMYRWRMKESLLGMAVSVAVYGFRQFSSCNKWIRELPTSFLRLQLSLV